MNAVLPFLIDLAILASLATLLSGLAGLTPGDRSATLTRWLAQRQDTLDNLYIRHFSAEQILLGTVIAAGLGGVLSWLMGSWLSAAVAVVIILWLPGFWLAHLRDERRAQFENQLPAALDQLAANTRAGLTLAQALDELTHQLPPPARQEFAQIVQSYRLGTDLKTALNTARQRLQSLPFGLAVSALVVNLDKGGNLPEALDRIAVSLKEIWRMEQRFTTYSAEGRAAIKIISLTPVGILLFISLAQPELIDSVTGSLAGWLILALAVALYVVGVAWARSLLRHDI
ncbi:MAG TPA: hypothetical protein DCS21_06240 [Gammaproteobacteria bacterium]|nr:hypothetical protein [Gammaproteobacteria bacterium]